MSRGLGALQRAILADLDGREHASIQDITERLTGYRARVDWEFHGRAASIRRALGGLQAAQLAERCGTYELPGQPDAWRLTDAGRAARASRPGRRVPPGGNSRNSANAVPVDQIEDHRRLAEWPVPSL